MWLCQEQEIYKRIPHSGGGRSFACLITDIEMLHVAYQDHLVWDLSTWDFGQDAEADAQASFQDEVLTMDFLEENDTPWGGSRCIT